MRGRWWPPPPYLAGTHPHMAVTAVSRLLELGLVKPADVARWLETSISDEPPPGPTRTAPRAASRGARRTPGTSRASPSRQSRRIE